jgi:HEPN domain
VPPPSPAQGTPREWLVRAQAKLALARSPLPPGAMWEDLSFWAQQAAELAIKAVYQQNGWLFPFIHDLAQGISSSGCPFRSPSHIDRHRQAHTHEIAGESLGQMLTVRR